MNAANKDEGRRCLDIAKQALTDGDAAKARKFGEKSRSLYPCGEVDRFLAQLGSSEPASSSSSSRAPDGDASGESRRRRPSAAPAAPPSQRSTDQGTAEQKQLVRQVLAARGDYYKVLGVDKEDNGDAVKRAYRKLALKLHPDKCKAAGAEDAFKEVTKAFACLSNPEKKAVYDRTGREDGMQGRPGGGGGGFSPHGEVDPEELFNMVFGSAFGMGPMHFGNGGFRTARMYRTRQPGPATPQQSMLMNILNVFPVLLLILLTFFAQTSSPAYSLRMTKDYRDVVHSTWHNVPYYVKNVARFEREYPYGSLDRRSLETQLEAEYRNMLMQKCRAETMHEQRMHSQQRTWGRKEEPAPIPKPSCEQFHRFTSFDNQKRQQQSFL